MKNLIFLLLLLPAPASSQVVLTGEYIVGMRPEPVDGHTMRIYSGSAAVYSATGIEQAIIPWPYPSSTHYLDLDVNVVGINGRDGGGLEDGHFYFYVLKSATQTGVIASRAIYYSQLILPPGGPWAVRKLPFGIPYRAAFGGFPPAHIDSWPQPSILFTDAQYGDPWLAIFGGRATSWTPISLEAWIPDNARVADLIAEVRDARVNIQGSCYIRSYGGQPTGILIGSTSTASPFAFQSVRIRTNSHRFIEYRCSAGSGLNIQVRGYSMTEPS